MEFKYELGITAWFWKGNRAYEGIITRRGMMEIFYPAKDGQESPKVTKKIMYVVSSKDQSPVSYEEHSFGVDIFTDKVAFVDKYIIIR